MKSVPFLTSALLLVLAPLATAQKKKPEPVPPAPIPTGIATAKTVFLSNVCELPYKSCAAVYNDLFTEISKQGKYQLVTSPADADLIFEISYTVRRDGSDFDSYLQLKIVDRATQVPLWTITEPDTETSSAIDAVVLDLSVLSRPGQTAGPAVKFSPKK
jgi:hypothetical protein